MLGIRLRATRLWTAPTPPKTTLLPAHTSAATASCSPLPKTVRNMNLTGTKVHTLAVSVVIDSQPPLPLADMHVKAGTRSSGTVETKHVRSMEISFSPVLCMSSISGIRRDSYGAALLTAVSDLD